MTSTHTPTLRLRHAKLGQIVKVDIPQLPKTMYFGDECDGYGLMWSSKGSYDNGYRERAILCMGHEILGVENA